ncbi:MAG: VOC family protein [Candidatus Binatia bacterium]
MAQIAPMIHGVNHIALTVADMKRTLEFYTGLLGMRLVGLFPMHGVPGAVHAFLDMGDGRLLSFIRFAAPAERIEDVTSPRNPAHPSAIGSMHHIALNVPDERTLEATKLRVEATGLSVAGPIDHGFCKSIYFHGPDREQLEVSTFTRPLDDRELDPGTIGHLGISAAELARMRRGDA